MNIEDGLRQILTALTANIHNQQQLILQQNQMIQRHDNILNEHGIRLERIQERLNLQRPINSIQQHRAIERTSLQVVTNTETLTINDIIDKTWQFVNVNGQGGVIKFQRDGNCNGGMIIGNCTVQNRWSFNGELTIYHTNGKPSTIFKEKKKDVNGK